MRLSCIEYRLLCAEYHPSSLSRRPWVWLEPFLRWHNHSSHDSFPVTRIQAHSWSLNKPIHSWRNAVIITSTHDYESYTRTRQAFISSFKSGALQVCYLDAVRMHDFFHLQLIMIASSTRLNNICTDLKGSSLSYARAQWILWVSQLHVSQQCSEISESTDCEYARMPYCFIRGFQAFEEPA